MTCFSSVASNDRDKEELDNFFDCDRNFIIISNAGKPIYSSYGDIYALSSIYATLYAMISKIQTYKFKPIDVSIKQRSNDEDFDSHLRQGSFGMNSQYSTASRQSHLDEKDDFDVRNQSLVVNG